MLKELTDLFIREGFIPHGFCLAWSPGLLWTLVVSEVLIGLSYYSIPGALAYFVIRRRDLHFNWMFAMFAVFIFACGTTHFISVINIWQPVYWLDAGMKTLTAAVSLATAIALWPLVPRALALPSRAELEDEVASHRRTEQTLRSSEESLRQLSESLEQRVAERTRELESANRYLQREIQQRNQTQRALEETNLRLSESLRLLRQQGDELTRLNEMSNLLQTGQTTGESCGIVARFTQTLFPGMAGAVYLVGKPPGIAEAVASWGDVPAEQQVFNPTDCWALRRGKIHPADDLQAALPCPHLGEACPHLCAPMIAHGETFGVLQLRGGPVADGGRGHALLETLAERAALTLANLNLRENLLAQSVRDPLTGLHNRRYLEETLLLEERRAARSGASLGIAMFDLDHFKALNDRHGHEAGDAALREFARLLQSQARSGDVACRYGGEEFTLILPGASQEVTLARAERIRASLEALAAERSGTPLAGLTVSAGVAAFPAHGKSSADVLREADRALYRAKQAGRNRVAPA